MVLATALLDTFGISPGRLEFLGVLMLLNELFLGVWLIVKGLKPAAFVLDTGGIKKRKNPAFLSRMVRG